MKYLVYMLILMSLMTACSGTPTMTVPQPSSTVTSLPVVPSEETTITPTLGEVTPVPVTPSSFPDTFTQMGITLPAPTCNSLTQPQMEGPYYKSGSPERNSLLEDGMQGTRLILVGYVLDQNCNPLPNTWIDFWQADAGGEYDNEGFRLRGHQFTDTQGRYFLETILPGLYGSRPIEHIHVKLQPEGGQAITSQLYFPNQPVDGLTVTLEDRGDLQVGYFNFVIPQ